MRITEHHSHPATDAVKTATPSSTGSSTSSSASSAASGDSQPAVQVSVSAAARELAASSPGIDEAKVARLRSAVDAGTLKIDNSKIAERIVEGD